MRCLLFTRGMSNGDFTFCIIAFIATFKVLDSNNLLVIITDNMGIMLLKPFHLDMQPAGFVYNQVL